MSTSPPSPDCPSDERLLAQLRPDAATDAGVLSHLDDCAACRARLESLAGAAETAEWSRDFDQWTDLSREITALLEPARAAGLAGASTAGTGATAWDDLAPHLDPSTEAASRGRLGGLDLLEIIGEGGMGLVLRARDGLLDREVAVKALKPTLLAVPGLAERFFGEARAVAALSHENVVPIHQVAEQRGLPYFVMPLVRGSTLEDRLRQSGPPPFPEALGLCLRIARGLAAAHAAGLIHRDVKPDNVLIQSRQGAAHATVWLADFGLVRREDEALDRSDLTATAGTPGYRAPEVAAGAEPDPRSDLYALGALCRQVGGDSAPAWFRQLCDRLLAGRPEDRPASAAEVVAHLESQHEALQATAWGRQAAAKWLRGAGWAAACALPVAGLITALDLSGRTRVVNASLEAVAGAHIEIEGRLGVFSSLAEAVAAARDGDTVLLQGPGPFPTGLIQSEGKNLTIAGADPESPARIYLDPHAKVNQPALWWAGDATLRLRDLEIHHEPPAGLEAFTQPVPSLIRIEGGTLEITRCTLRRVPVYGELQPIVILAGNTARIDLRDSFLHNTNATLVTWNSRGTLPTVDIRLENCHISGGRILNANGHRDGPHRTALTLHLSHCRGNLDTAFGFPRDADQIGVDIHLESCAMETRTAFFVTADDRPETLPASFRFRATGGDFAHLGDPPIGVPGLDFPALEDPGQPPIVWLREPIFVERRWQRIGEAE
jgi:hypothetical protein